MNALRKAAADYLALRRSMGFKLGREETRLRQFLAFMEDRKRSRITTALALEFATRDQRLSPGTIASRLSVVRGFAAYRLGADPATEVPPAGLLPARKSPAHPYLYSQDEIARLLDAAKNHPSWNRFPGPWFRRCRSWALYGIFGLLAVTGMRIGEVLRLRDEDIDWSEAVLTIRNTKFGKSRLVPLHPSTLEVLAEHAKHRDAFFKRQRPGIVPAAFFVNSAGKRFEVTEIGRVFLLISRQTGLRPPGVRHGPRLHDFRHRFAVETLLRWYRSGEDVERMLPALSTYLGHTHITGTYWYLSCAPELMAAAGERLEARWKGAR
jgi:integrase/recombinase XerD